jgi:HJR/Mrr/RecB family endonuclease
VLLVLGGSALLGWWRQQPPEGQLVLAIASLMTVGSGIGLIVLIQVYRKRKRALAWRRAMAHWARSTRSDQEPNQHSAGQLSPRELEQFAARIHNAMGYRVIHTGRSGDHGVDVKLVSPDGKLELVQCKQWKKPVGEPEVRDLFGAMGHERAVRCFIWAPGGFTHAARRWATGKSIVLADN